LTNFLKLPIIKLNENFFSSHPVAVCGHTDMMELLGIFFKLLPAKMPERKLGKKRNEFARKDLKIVPKSNDSLTNTLSQMT
jgi:hypothetical protein